MLWSVRQSSASICASSKVKKELLVQQFVPEAAIQGVDAWVLPVRPGRVRGVRALSALPTRIGRAGYLHTRRSLRYRLLWRRRWAQTARQVMGQSEGSFHFQFSFLSYRSRVIRMRCSADCECAGCRSREVP